MVRDSRVAWHPPLAGMVIYESIGCTSELEAEARRFYEFKAMACFVVRLY